MTKGQRIAQVLGNCYHRVHEIRYRNILGTGPLFRQEKMSPWVAAAWTDQAS
jgi:hypothetical protein